MKLKIILVLLVAGLFGCAAPTQIIDSWRDPNTTIKDPAVHKIVVAALIWDQGVRRQVEDYMASLYPGKATQSYLMFGTDSLLRNEESYNQKLKSEGYDGIVIMRQTNVNVNQHYVPGQGPAFYHAWGGYWGRGWGATVWPAAQCTPDRLPGQSIARRSSDVPALSGRLRIRRAPGVGPEIQRRSSSS